MEHIHGSYESENLFRIAPSTRMIINKSEFDIAITQCDHNSERFIFELPKIVDEHDMTLCSAIRVHYINIGTNGIHNNGVYEITDLAVNEDDDTIVNFSWLISKNATSLNGTLNFAIQFICETDGKIDYSWSTLPYKQIKISETYDNSDDVIDEAVQADILSQWKKELYEHIENNVDLTNYYTKIETDTLLSEKAEDTYVKSITQSAKAERSITLTDITTITSAGDGAMPIIGNSYLNNEGFNSCEFFIDFKGVANIEMSVVHGPSGEIEPSTSVTINGVALEPVSKSQEPGTNWSNKYRYHGPIKNGIFINCSGNESVSFYTFLEDPRDYYTKIETDTLLSETANAFVKMESGEVVRVDDVSPVGHTAKVKVKSKNLLSHPYYPFTVEKVGVTITGNDDGSITLNGTATASWNICFFGNEMSTITLPAGTYTFSLKNGDVNRCYLVVGGNSSKVNYSFGTEITFTLDEEGIVGYCLMQITSGSTFDNLTVYPQLEEGRIVTEYEPYVDPSTVTVTACGKNFWQSKLSYPRTVSGVTVDYDPKTQVYTFNGTSTAAGDIYTMPNNTYIMRINPGETWTLKVEVMGGDIDGEATSSGKISPLVNTTTYTNTIHANAESLYVTKKYTEVADVTKMYFYVYSAGIVFNDFKMRIQFELSDKPTEFEKFKELTNYTPTSEGDVEIDSIPPTMTVLTDKDGVSVELTYNQDSNTFADNVKSDLQELDNVTAELAANIGNFEAALDELHNYAQALIGGEA